MNTNRLTYTIHAVRGGWHLDEEGEALQWFHCIHEALEAARNLAAWLFETRGIPTQVTMLSNEQPSLVVQHG
jgi:hypothetical protein